WQGLLGEGEHANEDARFVLPNAAETKMLVTMNARELRHFFALRCCNRAQWEIRAVAWQMLESCLAVAPNLFANAGAPCFETGVCGEGKKSCGRPDEVRARHKALAAAANNNQGV
ncbi:MAG: FAD-dependent thymidylate synthase, partial [Clostridiales bacterium]|nr:FAD-dependent thymidylate synthase [Clostridiales bacterium]